MSHITNCFVKNDLEFILRSTSLIKTSSQISFLSNLLYIHCFILQIWIPLVIPSCSEAVRPFVYSFFFPFGGSVMLAHIINSVTFWHYANGRAIAFVLEKSLVSLGSITLSVSSYHGHKNDSLVEHMRVSTAAWRRIRE